MTLNEAKREEQLEGTPAITRFLDALFAASNDAGLEYCVLRNYEGLPERVGNDVDLLVGAKQHGRMEECVFRSAAQSGWELLSTPRRLGWRSYRMANCTTGEFFHVDVVDRLSWKGQRWLNEKDVLNGRRAFRTFYIPHPADEAAVLLFKDLLHGRAIREKYKARIVAGSRRNPDRFRASLSWAVGNCLADRIQRQVKSATWRKIESTRRTVRRAVVKTAVLRNPIEPIVGAVRFLFSQVLACRRRPNGFFLVLIGPDGSGKTTTADEIGHRVKRLFGAQRKYHGCFGFLPALRVFFDIGRRILGCKPRPPAPSGPDAVQGTRPHSRARCVLHVVYYSIDFMLGHLPIMRANTLGNLTVFDRYFYDWFIPQHFHRTPRWFLPILKVLLPRPDLVVYLQNSPATVHQRKPELTVEGIERQARACRKIVEKMAYGLTVSTVPPPEDVAKEIINRMVDIMTNRLHKSRRR